MNKFSTIFAVQNKFVGLLLFVIYWSFFFKNFFAFDFNGTYSLSLYRHLYRYNRCGEVARLLSPMWRGYQSCGEGTQPSVARLPNLWRDYLWRGYLVARLQSGYRWQSNISLESATFQLHFGFSSSFSAILHLNCIGKHIGLCFGSWDAEPWLCSNNAEY